MHKCVTNDGRMCENKHNRRTKCKYCNKFMKSFIKPTSRLTSGIVFFPFWRLFWWFS